MPCWVDMHGDLTISEQKLRRSGVGMLQRESWRRGEGMGEEGGETELRM